MEIYIKTGYVWLEAFSSRLDSAHDSARGVSYSQIYFPSLAEPLEIYVYVVLLLSLLPL